MHPFRPYFAISNLMAAIKCVLTFEKQHTWMNVTKCAHQQSARVH